MIYLPRMTNLNKKNLHNIDSFNHDLQSVLSEEEEGHYIMIVAERKKASLFLFSKGELEESREIMNPGVRKNIKTDSGELYGRNYKLSHHIDHQLQRHIQLIIREIDNLIKGKHINGIFIGGHKPLFHFIVSELPKDLQKKLRGEFITELNIPKDELIKHGQQVLKEYLKK